MGFLDIFRKKEPKEEPKPRSVSFDNLETFIKQEISLLENQTEEVKQKISENLFALAEGLKEQIKILEKVDISQRKEHERIKLVVLENFRIYISQLEKFSNDIESLDINQNSRDYILKVQKLVNEFKSSSSKSFEKATILIGKELEGTQILMRTFSNTSNEILKENKEVFEKTESLKLMLPMLNELNSLKETQNHISQSINAFEDTRKALQKDLDKIEERYKSFKKSSKYAEYIKEKEKIHQEASALNTEISRLKEEIDLKALSKYFHGNRKRSDLIKSYRENFMATLQSDNDLEIIEMTSNALNQDISQKVNFIKESFSKLKEESSNPVIQEISEFEEEIKTLGVTIAEAERKTGDEKKKLEKIHERESDLKVEILFKIKETLKHIEISDS